MKIVPLAEVKDRLGAYTDAARESGIVVTRNGKPVALLTPIGEDDDTAPADTPRGARKARRSVRAGRR
jgi:prevent-host-death family protein